MVANVAACGLIGVTLGILAAARVGDASMGEWDGLGWSRRFRHRDRTLPQWPARHTPPLDSQRGPVRPTRKFGGALVQREPAGPRYTPRGGGLTNGSARKTGIARSVLSWYPA